MSNQSSLTSGTCSKCGSEQVYVNDKAWNQKGSFNSNTIPITVFTHAKLKNYVCANCGFTESYVWKKSHRNKIKRKWIKVNQTQ